MPDANPPTAPTATRVLLFTDTLGDINGVSRFIRGVADVALATRRDLHVVTSTRFAVPSQPNIHNLPPVLAMKMPRYENLELVWPPVRRMLRFAAEHRPTAIHVSTPGPVGLVGRLAAQGLGVPLLGTYHTDFPAYIDRLFDLQGLTWLTRAVMSDFYRPFDIVFTRSAEYRDAMHALGVDASHLETLRPGITTAAFDPRCADASIWNSLTPEDASLATVRFLSVGRVSVEKNLPFLARVWRRADSLLASAGMSVSLIVVGDGPYLETMRAELLGSRSHFLGFREGAPLSRLYASSDAFLFPSTTDTLGQVVLEAQCSGLPVLVSNVGGPQSVVRHGATGQVLRADDEDAWVEAIMTLSRSRDLRQRMGVAARSHALGMTIESSVDHFWSVHERAVRTRSPRPATGA
jgi:glycosyltransferase involved in cell wall biosynthesis